MGHHLRHFLLIFNRQTGESQLVAEFTADESQEALRARFREERRLRDTNHGEDLEVVVLVGPSYQELRETHIRYFMTAMRDEAALVGP